MIPRDGNWTVHLNTGQVRSVEKARLFLAAPHVSTAYLLGDGHDWIDYCLDQPNLKTIVVRPYNIFKDNHVYPDETIHFRRKAHEPVGMMDAYHNKYRGNDRIFWIITNEPEHDGQDVYGSIRQQIKWIADDARYRIEQGYNAALGGWAAAKTIRIENNTFIDPEAWVPVLQLAKRYPQKTILDFHEYTSIHLAHGHTKNFSQPFPQTYLDWRALTDERNWGSIPNSDDGLLHNFYVGRRHLVRAFAKSIGLDGYHDGLGESPWDSMWEPTWKDFIDLTFTPLFGKPKGIRTLRRYMAWLHYMKHNPNHRPEIDKGTIDLAYSRYTTEQWCKDLISQLKWFKRENQNAYNTFFAYSTNHEWVDCCDISHPDFEGVIAWMMNAQNSDTDTTVPLEEEFIRSTGVFTYIRSGAGTEFSPIGQIPSEGVMAVVYPDDPKTSPWRMVEIGALRGWVHFEYIAREKPPSIEIRITLSPAQILALRDQLKNTP